MKSLSAVISTCPGSLTASQATYAAASASNSAASTAGPTLGPLQEAFLGGLCVVVYSLFLLIQTGRPSRKPLRIQVDGQTAELTIFRNQNGFFLPFVDSLAGQETYPAGRYLEPEELPGDRFFVDFNLAYNPLCAYNEMWSCPITPPENRLKVPIRAGEKLFHQ